MKPRLATWLIALGWLLIGCGAQNSPRSDQTAPTPSRPILGLITPSLAQIIPTQAPVATQQPTPAINAIACQKPSTWISYTVLLNDTLSALAYRSGTSVEQLQQVNCLNDTLIFAGQQLYLPTLPSVDPTNQIAAPAEPSSEPSPNPDLAAIATRTIDIPIPSGPNDQLLISPNLGIAGTSFSLHYQKFEPNANITYTIYNEDFALVATGELMADATGKITFVYVSPVDTPSGFYLVEMQSQTARAEASFEIIESSTLPKASPEPTSTKASPSPSTTPIDSTPTPNDE